jgi:hypothetical protein
MKPLRLEGGGKEARDWQSAGGSTAWHELMDGPKDAQPRFVQLLAIASDASASPDNREAALGDLIREFPGDHALVKSLKPEAPGLWSGEV